MSDFNLTPAQAKALRLLVKVGSGGVDSFRWNYSAGSIASVDSAVTDIVNASVAAGKPVTRRSAEMALNGMADKGVFVFGTTARTRQTGYKITEAGAALVQQFAAEAEAAQSPALREQMKQVRLDSYRMFR